MKTEIRKIWTKALRNGGYHQGTGCMYDEQSRKYCCLGVLTRLYINEHDIRGKTLQEIIEDHSNLNNVNGVPTAKVLKWAGLHHSTCDTLAYMNDNGKNFKEIAKYIEENL